ncbi:cellulase family glycosylhydrolase [Plebeiibacterium marinum]|uniref:Glycoside hydrolase family 5 protein n=1 Tax=Plebeiibacterium marinum TaxID=2992111 RepID=A0AAE3SKA7_9BACT|nr:cellulase family glycosylhydrolase [Plebeiobacterium marinum]MCW3806364.1 glycoside hydrolase family 5 protein [Plebeiobacterium marinum]
MRYSLNIFAFLTGLIFVLFSCQQKEQIKGFKTVGNQLLDANGNAFVMQGVNVPFAWHYNQSYQALDKIAAYNINCVRIVWESQLDPSGLDSVLQKCIRLKMIPMVELHDATGDSTGTKLYQLARYFVRPQMKNIIKKYEKHILLNIANEWGDHYITAEYWRDAYKKCVSLLRHEGYKSTIVIDAPGWGQNSEPVILYGQDLIDSDAEHNLLFSIHMYGSWNDEAKIRDDLSNLNQMSVPVIVGEFGYNYNSGDNNLNCKVNHNQIIQTCNNLGMGYLAWSWTGNNEENNWLDMVLFQDWETLTWWGEELLNSDNGIKASSKIASVFE